MSLFRYSLIVTVALIMGCDVLEEENRDETTSATKGIFILCEGVFGSANSSLWHLSSSLDSLSSNVYQALTGHQMGDTGQSLHMDGDALYVVMNASSTVEILDLSSDTLAYAGTINLAGASPREMVTIGNTAYVTSWGATGVLVIDLTTYAVTDTIDVGGLPEDILAIDGLLYVSIPWGTDFSSEERVVRINPATASITDTYLVGSGPAQLLEGDGLLHVSRLWFDENFTSYRGVTRVNLSSGVVTIADWGTGSGTDIFEFQGTIFVQTQNGVTALNDDLSLDDTQTLSASLATSYGAAADSAHIYVASFIDFSTPGEVIVYDAEGVVTGTFSVGIGPGAFAFSD